MDIDPNAVIAELKAIIGEHAGQVALQNAAIKQMQTRITQLEQLVRDQPAEMSTQPA